MQISVIVIVFFGLRDQPLLVVVSCLWYNIVQMFVKHVASYLCSTRSVGLTSLASLSRHSAPTSWGLAQSHSN